MRNITPIDDHESVKCRKRKKIGFFLVDEMYSVSHSRFCFEDSTSDEKCPSCPIFI